MTLEIKNMYENLIQEMIIDGIDGMTDEIKKRINLAPVEQQRAMILTILEENNADHRLLCSKIRNVVESNKTGNSKHIASVVTMLRKYVKVSDTEVKTMGEVMTPIELVEEMLDTLPNEVWTNPYLKWLEPCNGGGTFVSVAIKRLMKGLEHFEPNAEKRYEHIMPNMMRVLVLMYVYHKHYLINQYLRLIYL
jgi:type I restriction-modification system DNA methylase subunit